MKRNVLVIGAGKRVKTWILPALWCLRRDFEIAAVYSRSLKRLSLMNDQLQITTTVSLKDVNFKEIQLAIVAVTRGQVPAVLKALSFYDTKRIVLMLDTPVLGSRDIWASRFFWNFQKVLVSEDTIALPAYLLARKLIDEERIGALKTIYFFHNAYKYHAVASLKMLSGRSRVRAIINREFPNNMKQKEFSFRNGARALLYEPRHHGKIGRFLIEGETGFISDYEHAGRNVWRIGYVVENDIYKGITLNGARVPVDSMDERYLAGITDDLFRKSPMHTMKIRALMDLIASSHDECAAFHYSPFDGISDRLKILIADRLGYYSSAFLPLP